MLYVYILDAFQQFTFMLNISVYWSLREILAIICFFQPNIHVGQKGWHYVLSWSFKCPAFGHLRTFLALTQPGKFSSWICHPAHIYNSTGLNKSCQLSMHRNSCTPAIFRWLINSRFRCLKRELARFHHYQLKHQGTEVGHVYLSFSFSS